MVDSLFTVMLFSLQSSKMRILTAVPISIKSPLNQIELLIVYAILNPNYGEGFSLYDTCGLNDFDNYLECLMPN